MLTAVYDSASTAYAARDALVSAIPNIEATVHSADAADTVDACGFWANLKNRFGSDHDRAVYGESLRRGGCLVTARVPEAWEDAALDLLEQTDAVDIEARSAEWRAQGWQAGSPAASGTVARSGVAAGSSGLVASTAGVAFAATQQADLGEDRSMVTGYSSTAAVGGADREAAAAVPGQGDVIPVVEEELRVGKREVGRGSVRVRSYAVERPVEEQVELRHERVTIERRPVARELGPDEAAFQERTIEAVERGEEAVVSKTARVTEEINLRKEVECDVQTVRDSVRKTEIEIDDDRAGHAVTTTQDSKVGMD
jgi:uncharacterized protein (TIGR02271 family)